MAVLSAGLLALLLTGCGGPTFSAGEQGFVSGDGKVTVLDAPTARPRPARSPARTSTATRSRSTTTCGSVVVMPVWGSWCGPCRAEAPMLAAAARDLQDDGVVFLGIDSRDPNKAQVRAFLDRFDIPYDSIYDPDGMTLLSFHGTLPPNTIPSFVFIDTEGRVAARALDSMTVSTLYGVVEEVLGSPVEPSDEVLEAADHTGTDE